MLFHGNSVINSILKPKSILVASFAVFIFASSFQIANAQTAIYRSVGPSATSALTTGTTNAMTISGTTATFDVALADNIGVGDAIQYDSDGNNSIDAIAFIHGRTSSTVYTVADVAGATPTAVAGDNNWSIFRAYISLLNAEVGTENTGIDNAVEAFESWSGGKSLTAGNEVWNVALYANGTTADNSVTGVIFDGWTTSATQYLNIYTPISTSEVGTSQRHHGVYSTSYYYLTSGSNGITVRDEHLHVTGIQIELTAAIAQTGLAIDIGSGSVAASLHLSESILKGAGSAAKGIFFATNSTSAQYIWNNIIYDFPGFGMDYSALVANAYIYNNTVHNSGICFDGNITRTYVKNNIAQSCTTGYNGSFFSGSTNNNSEDGTQPGANGRTGSVTFVDENGDNFHLSTGDTVVRNYGADLSADATLAITTDIDRDTRVTPWDMGADETASVGRAAVKIRGGLKVRGGVKFR